MGTIAKQGVFNFIIAYIGVVIGVINTILLFPNIFSADEFGLTRIIVSAAIMSTSLFSFGINNIVLKFFPFFKDKSAKHNGFLLFVMIVPLVGYLLFLIISILFRPDIMVYYSKQNTLFSDNYTYVIILTFYLLYLYLFDTYLRALQKSTIYSFLDDIVLKCIWFVLILLYYFKYLNFNEFIFGYINAYGLLVLIELGYLIHIKEFSISYNLKKFDSKTIKQLMGFGLFTMFGAGITGTAATIDSLMIGALAKNSLSGVAFYSVAFYISYLIVIPFNALNRILNTSISEAWKNNDIAQIQKLYKESSNNLLIVAMLIFLGIWLNVDSFFELVPTEYKEAKYVLFFICIAKIYEVSVGINGIIINFSKYFKTIFYINILLICLLIATNYLLIPTMGIVGAAIATLFSTVIVISFYLVFLYNKYNILPFTNKSFYTILISLTIYFFINLIPDLNNVIYNLIIRSFLILVIFIPSIYYLKISSEINQVIDKNLNRIGLKK
ncbi:MAG: polysaccharide biosynthesis C-terminal domain-containing protein [Flavobacteriales bacterium]